MGIVTKGLSLLLITFSLSAQTHPYFKPPKEWQFAEPDHELSRVQVCFLGKNKKGLCPSINLASEPIAVSLAEYLKAVKDLHQADRRNSWRDLGKIQTCAGEARLTEIESPTEYGPLRMLQMIFVKENQAYIVTAAALKEEFSEFYREFKNALSSFTLTQDLIAEVPQKDRQEKLKSSLKDLHDAYQKKYPDAEFQTKYLVPFQNFLLKEFADMGPHWQLLALQQALL